MCKDTVTNTEQLPMTDVTAEVGLRCGAWLRQEWPTETAILARYQPVDPMTEGEIREKAKRAWQEQGIACLRPDQIDDEWTRRAVEAEAIRLYGKRASQKWK